MRYLLDTCACSYIIRERPLSVKVRFDRVGYDSLATSSVVAAELFYGAARHPKGREIRPAVDDFLARLAVLPWDEGAADHYGVLRAALERKGTPLGAYDMMIAAHALSIGATLVTNDLRHFGKIPDLTIEAWT
jgi:tRNA(fMet)-specific endonuclease VapC